MSISTNLSDAWDLLLYCELNMLFVRLKKARVNAGLSMYNLGEAAGLLRYILS